MPDAPGIHYNANSGSPRTATGIIKNSEEESDAFRERVLDR